MELTFRRANIEDIEVIMEILNNCVKKMNNNNNTMWDDEYPNKEIFLEGIRQGAVYLTMYGDRVVGSLTVNQIDPDDEDFDKDMEKYWKIKSNKPAHFNRLMVDCNCQGMGIGSKTLLHFEKVVKEDGYDVVRFFTSGDAANEKTYKLYERLGYTNLGAIPVDFADIFLAFEKVL